MEAATENKVTRFSFVRGLSISDLMTLANGVGGMGAILMAFSYLVDPQPVRLLLAMAFYPFCLVMDFFDGRVARARGRTSALGRELDSLADAVAFGVAPATVAYAAGLRGGWDALALLFFVACALGRLARYNATAHTLADDTGKVAYFEGVPVTGSLLMMATLAACVLGGHFGGQLPLGAFQLGPWVLHPLALGFVLTGGAMVSKTLHIPKP